MPQEYKSKAIIIGSGAAGCTAAIYLARANIEPILLTGSQIGGQLTTTTDVENYPGFAQAVQGPWLMEEMAQQAKNVGTKIIFDYVTEISEKTTPFKCIGESGDTYIADTVIIATGAQAKWLNLESEEKFKGYGVSGCATCDGFFFKNKVVMVIGGGNTAAEEALYLTNHATKVILVHRRDSLRAEMVLQNRIFNNPKIEVIWDCALREIVGNDDPKEVTGVVLQSAKDKSKRVNIDVNGVFIAIGHSPSTQIFRNVIDMDTEGYIVTKGQTMSTNINGVFAAGDVRDKIYRQAVTAAGDGCKAALEAVKFIDSLKESNCSPEN